MHPPDAHTQRNTESILGADSVSNFLLENGILVLQSGIFSRCAG